MNSLWFDPDPPSISAEEEKLLEQIDRGETDNELQDRLDRSLLIANSFVTLFSRPNEILRTATEVEASADTPKAHRMGAAASPLSALHPNQESGE